MACLRRTQLPLLDVDRNRCTVGIETPRIRYSKGKHVRVAHSYRRLECTLEILCSSPHPYTDNDQCRGDPLYDKRREDSGYCLF